MKIWVNGELGEEPRVSLPVFDSGLLFGFGLFESLRVHEGGVIQVAQHLERLEKSADTLGITVAFAPDALAEALRVVAGANEISDGAIRITATSGLTISAPFAIGSRGGTVFIAPREWSELTREWRVTSIQSPYRLGAELPRHKTLNYLTNLLARRAALAANADEALLVCDGRVLEGAMSNFFAVVDGVLRTAPVADGVLPGIVRASVLDLAKQAGVKVEERAVMEDDLPHATECFCTNSLIGVQPVTKVGGGKVGSGEIGELTRSLREGYERLIQSG